MGDAGTSEALSSTGPLLQKWFSDAFAGASPYRLFALSNVGSLLALLSYPFFFEVHWDSRQQAAMWSVGFLVFAVCCGFCAWWTFQARQRHARRATASAADEGISSDAPTWQRRALWIGLPALASIMFLAVTNEVCQNVATVPLLWIIPLSLYLVSFIVAFDHPRWYVRPICGIGALVLLAWIANFSFVSVRLSDALTAIAWNHVVQIQIFAIAGFAAILAGILVSLKNIVAGELYFLLGQMIINE